MKVSNYLILIALLTFSVALPGCFSTSTDTETEEADIHIDADSDEDIDISLRSEDGEDIKINIDLDDPAKALEGLAEKMEGLADKMQNGDGEKVEVINFRDLKEMLPNRVAGMRLDDSSGETSGALGFKISTATGEYRDDDERIEITIADVGASPMVLMGMAAWSNIEFERDSDDGYERTTTIEGYKGYEKYDSDREDGQVSLIINNRFLVNVEGHNISEKDLRSALRKVDLDDLDRLSKK